MLKERIATSWELFVVSWRSLRSHPRLMLFPVVGFLSLAAALGIFAGTITMPQWLEKGSIPFSVLFPAMMLGFITPWLGFLVVGLSIAGFYHEGIRALSGETPSVWRGIREAFRRIRALVFWALFAALVGRLLRLLGEQFGLGAGLAAAVTGIGWSAASFFVIPIIMREPKQPADPVALVRKSVSLLRGTWGEAITGYVGMAILGLPLFVVAMGGWLLARSGVRFEGQWLVIALIAIPLVLWQLSLTLGSAMYRCALYVYATEGVIPAPYNQELMEAGWKIRRGAPERSTPPLA